MNDRQTTRPLLILICKHVFLLTLLFMVCCAGIPTAGEREARQDQESIRKLYRPGDQKPHLPDLNEQTDLAEFMRFAMLNQPKVEAAYYHWIASIENITTARSLPDPRLTFQMYIPWTLV